MFFKDNLEFWVSQPSKSPICTLLDQITGRSDPLPKVRGFPESGITNTFAGREGKRECAGEEACAEINLVEQQRHRQPGGNHLAPSLPELQSLRAEGRRRAPHSSTCLNTDGRSP